MTNFQLCFGKSVRQSKTDVLVTATLDQLAQRILHPEEEVTAQVNRLRVMYGIDRKKYSEMKTTLPYFIPAVFKHALRHSANFEAAYGLVIDLDDLPAAGLNPDDIFARLCKDERIALMFRSPGGYGLKIVFGLAAPIRDTFTFAAFYKAFSLRFSRTYQLEKVMDMTTSDATRVCFLSADVRAWFNPEAKPLVPEEYVSATATPDLIYQDPLPAVNDTAASANDVSGVSASPHPVLPQEIMHEISTLLAANPASVRKPKQYYVPAQLDELESVLAEVLSAKQIVVEQVRPIQYGKQIIFKQGACFAEINFFFGKRGISMVPTTRSGHDPALKETLLHELSIVFFGKELCT
jgi:hypothetical protein